MKTIDGLYFYEFILLILGVLLFVTLLIILVVFVIQKRQLKELLVFFLLPVLMIGYPSIQKINYDKGVISIETQSREVAKNSQDPVSRENLKQNLKNIENRPNSNPESLLKFGRAQAILGDTVRAEKLVDRALNISPGLSEAKKLQSQFNTPQVQIEKIISEIKENPGNISKKTELKDKLTKFIIAPDANASVLMTAAKTHAALGDTSKAVSFANAALKKDVSNKDAVELKKSILKNVNLK